jgi:TonB family protein
MLKVINIFIMLLILPLSIWGQGNQRLEYEKSVAYDQGLDALKSGDNVRAVEKFREAIAETPRHLRAHYHLGHTLVRMKHYGEATEAFQHLIRLSSLLSVPLPFAILAAHYELGKLYLASSNYPAAAEEYRWLKAEGKTDELALYLSDLFPKEAAEQFQIPVSPLSSVNPVNNQPVTSSVGPGDDNLTPMAKMSPDLRPAILYKEKAKYTEIARINNVQGTVVLNVVFSQEGSITNIKVIRALPDGLTRKAVEAAELIRFNPAMKDGKAVSLRGNLEFTFNLY